MRLLLINTCGGQGMVALGDSSLSAPIIAEELLPGRASSESLMPAIARLFRETGWTLQELDGVAVVDGPGSFTGVRVGLSAAKGLCEAGGLGMVAASRLGLLAAIAGEGGAAALLDAGRAEFYCGIYRDGVCEGESLIGRQRALELAAEATLVTCEERVAEALADAAIVLVAEPSADLLLTHAVQRVEAGDWSDVAAIDARYLRRTDAEVKLDRKESTAG